MIALADEIGIAATIAHDKPVSVPVEVELPGQPKLQATMDVKNGAFADMLLARLSSIASRPLTRRDDTTKGALVVVGSQLRAYGTDRPRSAKVIVLGTPTSRSQDCGSYLNVKTGERVQLRLHSQELALQAFDPASGKPLGKATAEAKLECPDKTKAASFFGKANTDATFDEESVEHAVDELL
jgi:hypothetical protein